MEKMKEKLQHFEDNVAYNTNKIVLWIQEHFKETRADGIILGMSGGLDCCVVGALVKRAKLPLKMISMPRGMSMNHGAMNDVELYSRTFDIPFDVITIDDIAQKLTSAIKPYLTDNIKQSNKDMAEANIGPLLRMNILSTMGQCLNYVMIGTGNLTERTMGYFTKRGDGLSDFNPLGELCKSEIRILAAYLGISDNIIKKAPSADLWEGQSDEEEMGLKIIDIDNYILTGEGDEEIVRKIKETNRRIQHKLLPIPIFPRSELK